ncbi:beta-glucan synthesis-associated protein SKN1 [Agrocybe pediades]|nr:beta-glucan synthesis-associated protein SKN1 [Agrocybe pediades]
MASYKRFSAASKSSLLLPSSRNSRVSSNTHATRDSWGGLSRHDSVTDKYSLAASPDDWGLPLNMREDDDDLHNPRIDDGNGRFITKRGIANVGCLIILMLGILALFAGYPIISHFLLRTIQTTQGGFNLGGVNATGQVPQLPNVNGLIDRETPKDAYTKKSYQNPDQDMVLVFSDEFNQDGRTFYPGDDPYWEAVDLHYWGTVDLEWYDPMQATTSGGYLRLRIDRVNNTADNHDLQYRSGMIQSWNKFCFTGGMIEAGLMLPGSSSVSGLWPALWTMGNLGRAGYGASLEGLWPYSYDSCDVGTLPNQTFPLSQTDGILQPVAATVNGDPLNGGVLSFLPGQRLSACTCAGEDHPGPIRKDGTYVGRSSPEIDVLEAIVNNGEGFVSQSSQWAPFNAGYQWDNATNLVIYDPDVTQLNGYIGGAFQQTTSGLSETNQACYESQSGCFSVYGFEYKTGFDDGYITWVNDGKLAWTLKNAGMGPDSATQIGRRYISQEPMYIIANLGLSLGFGDVDFEDLIFPSTMSIDYIRVYQPADAVNVGCDPDDFPTTKYIETFQEAYTNPNLTTWVGDFKQSWPKNKLVDSC